MKCSWGGLAAYQSLWRGAGERLSGDGFRAAPAGRAAGTGGVRVRGLDGRALLQFVLAIHHHALARSEALLDEGFTLLDLGDFHRANFDLLVLLDHESESALRPALNHRGGHDPAVFAHGQKQPRVDKLPRPKRQVAVRKRGFEFDGAGGGIDLIVDHGQLALPKNRGVVPVERVDADLARRHLPVDLAEGLLRQREDDGDGAELGDDNQPVRVLGVEHGALVDQPDAGAAIDWRDDGRIFKLDRG